MLALGTGFARSSLHYHRLPNHFPRIPMKLVFPATVVAFAALAAAPQSFAQG